MISHSSPGARRETELEAAWREHGGTCLARARGVLRDRQMAEDAVQEAFVDHWLHPGRFDAAQSSLGSWLVMLTHRKAVDRVRAERRRQARSLDAAADLADETASPFDLALGRVHGAQATAALADLPATQREAIVLAYWGGYSQSEIAEITATPIGTVKGRMRRGLLRLGEVLGPVVEREPQAVEVRPRRLRLASTKPAGMPGPG